MRDENKINIISKSFTAPLKEARESFEKEYLINQLKKITETSLKLLTL